MKTKRILSILLCAAFVMITFTNKVNASSPTADVESTAGIESTEESSSSLPEIDPNNYTLDELNAFTEALIKSKAGEDCQVRFYDDCIVIDLWIDGMYDYAELAKNNDEYKETWDSAVESMRDMSEVLYGLYSDFDRDVYVYILNDNDHDNVLVMVMNGIKIFDCVNDDEETGATIDMTRMRFR